MKKIITDQSIISDVRSRLAKDINRKVNELIIQGLARKGYEFKTDEQVSEFISENCNKFISHDKPNEFIISVYGESFLYLSFSQDTTYENFTTFLHQNIYYKFL